MNAQRRKELATIAKQLSVLKQQVDSVSSDEEESYDSMPDSLKEGERGNDSQEAIENLQGISSMIDDALDELCTLADVVLPVAKPMREDESNPGIKYLKELDVIQKARDRRRRKENRAYEFMQQIGYLVILENRLKHDAYSRGRRERVSQKGALQISKAERIIMRKNDLLRKELKASFDSQNLRITKLVQKFSIEMSKRHLSQRKELWNRKNVGKRCRRNKKLTPNFRRHPPGFHKSANGTSGLKWERGMMLKPTGSGMTLTTV